MRTLVQNPNAGAVRIEITSLPENGGTPVTFTDEIASGSRRTCNMAGGGDSYLGFQGRASILACSLGGARPIMAERAMYCNDSGLGPQWLAEGPQPSIMEHLSRIR